MSQPYVGEIRIFAGSFAPAGWMDCDGTPLPIAENDVLFQVIGTTYGGDGQTTFNLPDLRGRVPVHQGQGAATSNYTIGQADGVEQVTLTTQQIPSHSHAMLASTSPGANNSTGGNIIAASPTVRMYVLDIPDKALAATAVGPDGGSQPHENLMPYITIRYIISLYGIYPSQ
jgi:microcystin-dependent protein